MFNLGARTNAAAAASTSGAQNVKVDFGVLGDGSTRQAAVGGNAVVAVSAARALRKCIMRRKNRRKVTWRPEHALERMVFFASHV